jgi:hypothetical protein
MKKLLFPAIIACSFAITSCSRYQVNLISSTNANKNQQTGDFEFENDSVKISYSFFGENAPVNVSVYNKLNNPLYISYAANDIAITGNVNAQTDHYRVANPAFGTSSYTSGNINAVANLPQHSTFLPPHSQGSNASVHLTNGFLVVPDSAFSNDKMPHRYPDPDVQKVKTAVFEKVNSPLVFKSYLTLYLVNGNEVKPVTYQQDFYVSKSFTTTTEPNTFQGFEQKRGDYFISSKPTGYAGVAAGVGVAAVVVGGAALINSVGGSSK